jgi:hypothetical protein
MIHDAFQQLAESTMTPSDNCFAITPDDLNELPYLTKAVYIGSDGDLVACVGDSTTPVTFRNLVAGSVLDIRVRIVKLSGTTAGDLVGLA